MGEPMATTCRVRLQPEAGYTNLTPVCGKPAKGEMPDGTPACGIHLRSKSAIALHTALADDGWDNGSSQVP